MTEAALAQAAARMEAVLRAENAALAALDIPGAAALLEQKIAAAQDLHATAAIVPAPPAAAARLQALAQENKCLLERAMRVQGRILEMVIGAARRAAPAPGRYGASGAAVLDHGALALVLRT